MKRTDTKAHRRRGAATLAVMALVAAACSDRVNVAPSGIEDGFIPETETMMAWIEEIVAQGTRRPGYPADAWTEAWARDRFVEMGLEDVRLDPIDVARWEPHRWSLEVWREGEADQAVSIPCYAVPLSAETAPGGFDAEIRLLPPDSDLNLEGRIAVVENEFIALPQSIMPPLFARWFHDPGGEFDTLVQTLPFSTSFADVMGSAIEAKAGGFVGILRGLPWETDRYYVPYDGIALPLPGVWLSSENGDRLLELMAAGFTRARVRVNRTLEPARSHNVVGVLPGASDEWIIVGSHHDGPWASAVEDAGGVALVMAQAQYWSRMPRSRRPHNLLFLLNGGHMSGGAGLIHFVETNRAVLEEEVLVEIHLEHPAREARGENGVLVPTDAPEVRWWFTSFVPPLEEVVTRAICEEDLGRSLLMPPAGFPPGSEQPPTDAAFFHPLTPIVSFLTAPMYLFDEADTLDMVHEASLVPLTRATIRIINGLASDTAAGLRGTTYVPPRAEPIAGCAP